MSFPILHVFIRTSGVMYSLLEVSWKNIVKTRGGTCPSAPYRLRGDGEL